MLPCRREQPHCCQCDSHSCQLIGVNSDKGGRREATKFHSEWSLHHVFLTSIPHWSISFFQQPNIMSHYFKLGQRNHEKHGVSYWIHSFWKSVLQIFLSIPYQLRCRVYTDYWYPTAITSTLLTLISNQTRKKPTENSKIQVLTYIYFLADI